MKTFTVEDIRRLDVKPGETLVASVAADTTPDMARSLHEALLDGLPDGVKVLVVAGEVDLSVVDLSVVAADAVARS